MKVYVVQNCTTGRLEVYGDKDMAERQAGDLGVVEREVVLAEGQTIVEGLDHTMGCSLAKVGRSGDTNIVMFGGDEQMREWLESDKTDLISIDVPDGDGGMRPMEASTVTFDRFVWEKMDELCAREEAVYMEEEERPT